VAQCAGAHDSRTWSPDHRDDVAARDRVCGWHVAVPLLIAGVGGGMIISPILTLALQNVSVAMAGAAGGAVQARRIGDRLGRAHSVFYSHLRQGPAYQLAISTTLMYAAGFMLLALSLSLSVVDLLRQSRRFVSPEPHRHLSTLRSPSVRWEAKRPVRSRGRGDW
jgi:hypothetical protein